MVDKKQEKVLGFQKVSGISQAEIEEFIRTKTTLFRELNDEATRSIAGKMVPGTCLVGAEIMRQGEMGDCFFVVTKGRFDVFIIDERGRQKKVGNVSSGGVIGEGALVTNEPRNATVKAVTDAGLLRLSSNDFQGILRKNPREMEIFVRIISKRSKSISPSHFRPSAEKLQKFLGSVGFFSSLNRDILKKLEPKMQWLFLPAGEVLMRQGTPGKSMYIMVNGRLRYVVRNESGEMISEGEFVRGDIIGEMALLTGARRSATVYATRGSELVQFSTKDFQTFFSKNPEALFSITKTLANRLIEVRKSPEKKRRTRVVTLLQLHPEVKFREFAEKLCGALNRTEKAIIADKAGFVEFIRKERGSEEAHSEGKEFHYSLSELLSWFYMLEEQNDIVLLCAEPSDRFWTESSLQHTDKILMVANHDSSEKLYPVEIRYLSEARDENSPGRELVFLYEKEGLRPENTRKHFEYRKVNRYHHIRTWLPGDMDRMVRNLLGRSIGVVLGGGGAKGAAHLGVLKALDEAGIPIDHIGGTSVGSIMGALYAMGLGVDEMINLARELMVRREVMKDYTFPMVSILTGKKHTNVIKEAVDGIRIEDLWIPYFAVATDLTQASKKVFDEGHLWKAIRASTSLPGIFPPLYDHGSLYVDGALLDNVPGSVLKGKKVGHSVAVNLGGGGDKGEDEIYAGFFEKEGQGIAPSWLTGILGKINPFAKKVDVPGIFSVIMRSTMINSVAMTHETKRQSDIYVDIPLDGFSLFNWDRFDEMVEVGYQYVKERCDGWKEELELGDYRDQS